MDIFTIYFKNDSCTHRLLAIFCFLFIYKPTSCISLFISCLLINYIPVYNRYNTANGADYYPYIIVYWLEHISTHFIPPNKFTNDQLPIPYLVITIKSARVCSYNPFARYRLLSVCFISILVLLHI